MTTEELRNSAVLHVSDDPEDVQRAVGTAALLTERRGDLEVRIIVNGPALAGVTTTENTLVMPAGVSVQACRTGLSRQGVPQDRLQPGIGTVDSAAVALIDAQHQGAAYLRI